MVVRVIKAEIENFRGTRAPVQIITLSCSYAELMAAYGHAGANLVVRIMGPTPYATLGHLARVNPISAPAMLTIPLSEPPIQVGAELTLGMSTG
jgi:hypothetical protein